MTRIYLMGMEMYHVLILECTVDEQGSSIILYNVTT